MKIAVCMKYVPADMSRGIDEQSGGIERTEDNSAINQADIFALETALYMKKKYGGSVSVFTMGPKFAENLLREACALGADELNLISDRRIAGSDSYATALILAAAVKEGFDLVLCGERTVDGETAQVPGEISARLDLPFVCGVTGIESMENGELVCVHLSDRGEDVLAVSLPAVLSISSGMSGIDHPLRPSPKGMRMAREMQARQLDLDSLGVKAEEVGIKGAPTQVAGTVVPDWTRQCQMAADLNEGVQHSLEVLHG